MRAAAVSGLLLIILAPAASASLESEVDTVQWHYGPETWKTDPDQDPLSVLSPTRALGVRVDMRLSLGSEAADADLEAVLTDGVTEVEGRVLRNGSSALLRFDVDGGEGPAGADRRAGLGSGPWALHVTARANGSLVGTATHSVPVRQLSYDGLGQDGVPVRGAQVPAQLLPMVDETGADRRPWLPLRPLTGDETVTAAVDAGGPDIRVDWQAWAPPSRLPDATWQRHGLGSSVSGSDGVAVLEVGPDVWEQTVGDDPALWVVSAQGEGAEGGVAAFVLARGPTYELRDLRGPEPGAPAAIQVRLEGPAELLPPTVAAVAEARVLSQAPAVPAGDGVWQALLDARPMRDAGASAYDLLAFAQGPQGNYSGHAGLRRGLAVDVSVPPLGVGQTADIEVEVRNRAEGPAARGLAVAVRMEASFFGEAADVQEFQVPAGGTLTREITVEPQQAGTGPLRLQFDTGDLRFGHNQSAKVLDAEEIARETAPWHDPSRYVPMPFLLVLLALGVALAGARQKR